MSKTPIRVCMLVRNDVRTDYRVLKEASSLARAGYQVTVIGANLYGPAERENYGEFEIVRVAVARGRSSIGKAVNLLPRMIGRMAQAAQTLKADIYHAHDSDAILPAWLGARRVPGAKLLYDAHELGFMEEGGFQGFRQQFALYPAPMAIINWAWNRCNDWIVRQHVDAMITVNDLLADLQAIHYGVRRPRLVMNCPPRQNLQADRSFLARKLGVPGETPIVIYQGMMERERHGVGLENLIECAPLLKRKAVTVLLGRGSQFTQLQQLAAKPIYEERVFVLPAVPPSQLMAHTVGATIGVIPTELWHPSLRFSSPNKLFEYLNAGLPVVTSNLPIIQRICEEYQCGLSCDPTLPQSIADAINQLLENDNLYNSCCAGARRAAEFYNWERQEQTLLDVYAELTGQVNRNDPLAEEAI